MTSDILAKVLRSAARLQEVVPDAVLVGGSAEALYAGHRDSFDHDHVLTDLVDRYDTVLEAVEAGLRQLGRSRPLETSRIDVGDGLSVVAPTVAETLRVKAYLVVQRNVVRDYLDVVALADHVGGDVAVTVLAGIDDYYIDRSGEPASVLTALVIALADPTPFDTDVIDELPRYKGLASRWHDWSNVVDACHRLALELVGAT